VLVDDGLATGVTARAACQAVKAAGAAAVVLAVPVGSSRTVAELRAEGIADVVVCLRTPKPYRAVGAHYLVSCFGPTGQVPNVPWLSIFEHRAMVDRSAASTDRQ
jgi:putative phosphoribosyl transferase